MTITDIHERDDIGARHRSYGRAVKWVGKFEGGEIFCFEVREIKYRLPTMVTMDKPIEMVSE